MNAVLMFLYSDSHNTAVIIPDERSYEDWLFIGEAAQGPLNTIQLVTNVRDALDLYGGLDRLKPLSLAMIDYFRQSSKPVWSFRIEDGIHISGALVKVIKDGQYKRADAAQWLLDSLFPDYPKERNEST